MNISISANIFIMLNMGENFFHHKWQNRAFWDITEREGGEYLIITKEILILASASYAPHESFFHQGQKHTISNFIRAYSKGGESHP